MPNDEAIQILNESGSKWEALGYEEWERRHRSPEFLSASQVPAILGKSPWESPFSLFQKLKGYFPQDTSERPLRFQVGSFLEPLIARTFNERTGRRTVVPGETTVIYHPDLPWFYATPDRLIIDDAKPGPGLLEMKTVATMTDAAEEWLGGTPPLAVQIQITAQSACMPKLQWGSVAGLIGLGQDFAWHDMVFDAELAAMIMEEVAQFKWRLDNDKAPDPDGSNATTEAIKERFQNAKLGSEVILPFDVNDIARDYYRTKGELDAAEIAHEAVKNQIRQAMGENEVGVCGLNRIKWTSVERTGSVHFNTKDLSPKQIRDAMNALAKLQIPSSMTEGSTSRRLSMPKTWK